MFSSLFVSISLLSLPSEINHWTKTSGCVTLQSSSTLTKGPTVAQNTFITLPTKSQFKWLADQLRASRAVIDLCQRAKTNMFSNFLPYLELNSKGGSKGLSSYVNAGMRGFSVSNLADPVWQYQFQYRVSSGRGVKQYPDGDLYLPPMEPDCRLKLADMTTVWDYPISSIMFRLDASTPTTPVWWATLHINQRPVAPKRIKP